MAHQGEPNQGERLVGSDRVLAVLLELGRHPEGATLEDIASALASPKSTVHRALASLRKASLAELTSRGVYALGDEFFRLAFSNHAARPDTARIEPLLSALAAEYGETVHYAVLDGKDVVYRAKVDPSQGAVKLTSTVGGRNPAYRTAVGKLLLAHAITTREQLSAWLQGEALEAKTASTITDPDALFGELQATLSRGYGIDDEENELGLNCVAVPVFGESSAAPMGAISVSALRFRYPLERLIETAPILAARVRTTLAR
ncbi:IclR family transcriptional regulator [Arthrobacter sedimenti]|uniref:IclR family transcriptional regulator n=1 Tax=Arthrobacter sedimenti TaxID=2694931 RepID=UPI000B35EC39|nr:IclR family transcriptional regulator [Arthrobacter sedimenti]OUM41718.1 IclR family transcriptional regulator [Arthrobacter agilis]